MHIGKQRTQLHNVVKYPLSQPLYGPLHVKVNKKKISQQEKISQKEKLS